MIRVTVTGAMATRLRDLAARCEQSPKHADLVATKKKAHGRVGLRALLLGMAELERELDGNG